MSDVLFETDDNLSEANLSEWLANRQIRNYVDRGAGVTTNFSGGEVTIEAGDVYLEDSQDRLYKLLLDQQTLTLPDSNGANYVYATFDPGVDDTATWQVGSSPGDVSDPKLLRAVVDTALQRTDLRNENPGEAIVTETNSPYLTQGEDVVFADAGTTITLASADASIANQVRVTTLSGIDDSNPVNVETEGSEAIDPGGETSKTITEAGWTVPFTWGSGAWESGLSAEYESVKAEQASVGDQPHISYWPPVWVDEVVELDTTSAATAYATISLSTPPADATHAILRIVMEGDGTAARGQTYVREAGTGRAKDGSAAMWAGHGDFTGKSEVICPMSDSNEIEYLADNVSTLRIRTTGYF